MKVCSSLTANYIYANEAYYIIQRFPTIFFSFKQKSDVGIATSGKYKTNVGGHYGNATYH